MALEGLSHPAESLLLDCEPTDTSDVRDVRHWIRVYTALLELVEASKPAGVPTQSFTRRVHTWRDRLDFWQERARAVSNPPASKD